MDDVFIKLELTTVYGKMAGDPAAPLLLGIHGWSQRNGWHTWEPLIEPLAAAGYYVVSIDMPGWGKSEPWGEGTVTSTAGVEAVVQVMDALEKDTAVLLGKSWGGGIALKTAALHQKRITKLILTAPAFRELDLAPEIIQPVLLVWAKDDPVIPIIYSENYLSILPDAELVTFETGGHSAAPKNAVAFAPTAIEFLHR